MFAKKFTHATTSRIRMNPPVVALIKMVLNYPIAWLVNVYPLEVMSLVEEVLTELEAGFEDVQAPNPRRKVTCWFLAAVGAVPRLLEWDSLNGANVDEGRGGGKKNVGAKSGELWSN